MLINLFFFFILEKYIYVGRLLKPGEQPTNYSDEDDETTTTTAATADKPKEEWPNYFEMGTYEENNINLNNHHLCDLFGF